MSTTLSCSGTSGNIWSEFGTIKQLVHKRNLKIVCYIRANSPLIKSAVEFKTLQTNDQSITGKEIYWS